MKLRVPRRFHVLAIVSLAMACHSGRASPVAPTMPNGAPAACTVIYVGPRKADPRSECLAEMVYAELHRRRYLVYRIHDDFWSQPVWDYFAYVGAAGEEPAPRRRAYELTVGEPGSTWRLVAKSDAAFEPDTAPREDAVSSWVSTVLGAVAVDRQRSKNACPDTYMDAVRPSPEPNVAGACASWVQK